MTQLPTKKQKQILDFIATFTVGNGYGPSYREVMQGLGYKSVSTVATHIDGLIAKGYLRKGEGYSARSLEITTPQHTIENAGDEREKWLDKEFVTRLKKYEQTQEDATLVEAKLLAETLRILGFEEAYESALRKLSKFGE